MNYILALIGAGIVGICVALEPTINSGLGRFITPRLAVLHSFLLGTIVVVIINLFSGGFKEYRKILNAPPYFWVGGIIGLGVVYLGAKVTPIIGLASTLTIMVAVQLVTGMVIDSFGLLGVARVPFSISKVIGLVLMVVAVKLIIK